MENTDKTILNQKNLEFKQKQINNKVWVEMWLSKISYLRKNAQKKIDKKTPADIPGHNAFTWKISTFTSQSERSFL